MVKVLTLLALVISLNASAQRAPEPGPELIIASGLAVAGTAIGIGFTIGSINNQARAGRILQAK